MSAPEKIRRQGKGIKKIPYLARLHECNYDWLCAIAREKRVSMSAVLNAILRGRPAVKDGQDPDME